MRASVVRPVRIVALLLLCAGGSLAARGPQFPPPARPPKAAPAMQSTAELPKAREVIDRHIKAVGGRETIRAHSSSHATGTIAVPSAGLSGTLEVFAARPNSTLLKIVLAGVGEVQEGFDGRIGWSISAMTGPTLLEGRQLEQRKFDSDFYGDLVEDNRYKSMTVIEIAEFDGRQCYKLRLIRHSGEEDLHYYDLSTGLKAGSTTTRETPMGTVTATTVESDYRRFGKLLQPTKLTQRVMGVQQVLTVSSIEYDSVDRAVFEPPAPIKALLK
ncbi:MAG TPA: hypothetical protein VLD67_19445 [Vicinamibacterales bacterium]|nr:hypothetical protein [Vicinamibacterales bacterium]